MARAYGSYPYGRWFKSTRRYHIRPIGQVVKTPPFHGDNRGSTPLWVTIRHYTDILPGAVVVSIKKGITALSVVSFFMLL